MKVALMGDFRECGRLSIGLRTARRMPRLSLNNIRGTFERAGPIGNRPQGGNPPHNGILQTQFLAMGLSGEMEPALKAYEVSKQIRKRKSERQPAPPIEVPRA